MNSYAESVAAQYLAVADLVLALLDTPDYGGDSPVVTGRGWRIIADELAGWANVLPPPLEAQRIALADRVAVLLDLGDSIAAQADALDPDDFGDTS